MEKINLNILRLAEVRWKGADPMRSHTHKKSVDILFDETTAKRLGSWCPISDRVLVDYLKPEDIIIIIIGEFYANVGDKRVEDVVGPSGIETINERGCRLIEWCQINCLTITNTWYQNHPRRQ
ncbi:craniofacial development protein 2-like [Plakobranchus ocellatus]|uniref:Craniofacial development protein 2-like n=1 Tax=Plakobranchus ocellatus TaxID=259542 RepID=A0AAV4DUT8_9GAST|nr:craniofacial development protein 2-like [Plakobranchus ocellatus]